MASVMDNLQPLGLHDGTVSNVLQSDSSVAKPVQRIISRTLIKSDLFSALLLDYSGLNLKFWPRPAVRIPNIAVRNNNFAFCTYTLFYLIYGTTANPRF